MKGIRKIRKIYLINEIMIVMILASLLLFNGCGRNTSSAKNKEVGKPERVLDADLMKNAKVYPIAGKWVGNEYRVEAIEDGREQYLGCRIVAINNIPLKDVVYKYERIKSSKGNIYAESIFEKMNQEGLLVSAMQYLGIDEDEDTGVTVIKDGKEVVLGFDTWMKPKKVAWKRMEDIAEKKLEQKEIEANETAI